MLLRNVTPALLLGLLVVPADSVSTLATDQYRFEIDTHSVTDLTELGQGEIESTANLNGLVTVNAADDQSVTVVLDTIAGSSEGQGQQITPELLAELWGTNWTGMMDDKGRLSELETESTSALSGQIEGNLLRGLLPYIAAGASVGDSWSDTLEFARSDSTGSQETTTYIEYTVTADSTYQGMDALVVSSTYVAETIIYQETSGGLDIEGASDGTGVHYVGEGGRYLGGVREVVSELEVSGEALPAIIPVTATSKLTIERMP